MASSNNGNKSYPFAVITPGFGVISETFINRHITQLLPGKTVVVARAMGNDINDLKTKSHYLLLDKSKYKLKWFYNGILHILRINKLSPVQVSVENFLKKFGVRTILSEYLDDSLRWIDIAKNLGISFYAHAHGYDISTSIRNPEICRQYLKLENADGVITMSEYSKKKLSNIGLSGANISVIPYGIDIPDTPVIRENRNTIRCLAVGRMVNKKAPLLTIKAFHKAVKINPLLHLDYIGNGELYDKVSEYVNSNSLLEFISLHGSQPNSTVHKLMKRSDIFIQHSMIDPITGDEEGLPVAILEAMANNLPVISTKHAGIPEAVVDGATGYLVDEGNISDMANRILKLAGDLSLRIKLGLAGWERVKYNFSWEKEKKSLLEIMRLSENN